MLGEDWIYLDNNATTRPLPEVVEAMLPFLRDQYANPSSVHQFGQSVRHQIECARESVAGLIGASPREIIFTSGGTESINLALFGALATNPNKKHVVTTAVEHVAVLRVAETLTARGYTVDFIGVDRDGRLDRDEFEEKVTDQTALVSLIHTNNETGVIADIEPLCAYAQQRGAVVHVDAIQSAGKMPLDVTRWSAHLVSLAAHKFHGVKGAGALYVRRRTRIDPLIVGGSQERMNRGGTENVAGIIGMGSAARSALQDMDAVSTRVRQLRDELQRGILERVHFAHINAGGAPRIHNTTNVSFEGLEAEAILILLSENRICASSGSACSSGSLEPSHVLKAMGIEERIAHGAIRFSLSRFTTREEIDHVLDLLPRLLSRLTHLSTV